MSPDQPEHFTYTHCEYSARMPAGYLYSPSHCWLAEEENSIWRVGLTSFATQMLGEVVEFQLTPADGSSLESGQAIGSIEGFKTLTEIHAVGIGRFLGGNPALANNPALISNDPWHLGWLYKFQGTPDETVTMVESYQHLLTSIIDRIMAIRDQEMNIPRTPHANT